jgi:hypothetical protein
VRYSSRSVAAAAVPLLVGLAAASPAAAQRPQTRQGLWFAAGAGLGSAAFGCEDVVPSTAARDCTFTSDMKGLGPTVHVRLGGTFETKLLLGIEADIWTKSAGGISSTGAIFGTSLYIYPSEERGLFIGGGFAHMIYSADDGVNKMKSQGFGLIVGVGRDFRIAPNMSLTPLLNVSLGGFGDWRVNEVRAGRSFSHMMLDLGVELTLH